jgi:hypothetical protein
MRRSVRHRHPFAADRAKHFAGKGRVRCTREGPTFQCDIEAYLNHHPERNFEDEAALTLQ